MKIKNFIFFSAAVFICIFGFSAEIKAEKTLPVPDNENISIPAFMQSGNSAGSFNIKGIDYTIEDAGLLTDEEHKLAGSFKIDDDNLLFIYTDFLRNKKFVREGIITSFNVKNKAYEELIRHNDTDYTGAIRLKDGRILLTGHKTAIFNPVTKEIKPNNDRTAGSDFHTVQKDDNTILRFLPDSKPGRKIQHPVCRDIIEYMQVLETDLNTGDKKEINRIETPCEFYKRGHITLEDNRILSYAIGSACINPDMNLYLYDIKKNEYKKLMKINGIGFDDAVSAQKLNNGYILFTGGTNECSKAFDTGNKEYLNSIIYDADKNKIVKKVKMLYAPLSGYAAPVLIPLKTGDLLIIEEGRIRQYFDINAMEFKPLEKEIVLKTQGGDNITVLNGNTIVISHGNIKQGYGSTGWSTQAYILRSSASVKK